MFPVYDQQIQFKRVLRASIEFYGEVFELISDVQNQHWNQVDVHLTRDQLFVFQREFKKQFPNAELLTTQFVEGGNRLIYRL